MAQSLEGRVKDLKSKLEGLKQLYTCKERPLAVDLEIQIIQEQINNLVEPAGEPEIFH